jgi:hypothetical protein
MLSTRRFGLLLSIGLSLLTQQPVLPASVDASPIGTIYDTSEHVWKRWTVSKDESAVSLEMSVDGTTWSGTPQVSFAAAPSNSWDNKISSAVVTYDPAACDGRHYLLWYVGAANGARQHDGLSEGNLGLATSADGRTFQRLLAAESPYHQDGVILEGHDAFPGNSHIVASAIGKPQYSSDDSGHHVTFYKVGFDERGGICSAGVERATSADGTRWQVQSEETVSMELVGSHEHAAPLVDQLQRLVAACSNASVQ